jgi:hypothetical protein
MDAILSQSRVHENPAPVPILQDLVTVLPEKVHGSLLLCQELVHQFAVVLRMTEGVHWFEGSRRGLCFPLHDLEQMDDLVRYLKCQFSQTVHGFHPVLL